MSTSATGNPPILNINRLRKTIDFGNAANNCFDLERTARYLYLDDPNGDGGIKASPVFIIDPCQAGNAPLKTATLLPSNQTLTGTLAAGALTFLSVVVGSFEQIPDGSNAGGVTVAVNPQPTDLNVRSISAANAVQVLTVTMYGMARILSIAMVASGGTATLQVAVSTDNTNFINIEAPIAAALAIYKTYDPTTRGATNALSPLAYRYVKITVGAAGAGFTTQLDVGVK